MTHTQRLVIVILADTVFAVSCDGPSESLRPVGDAGVSVQDGGGAPDDVGIDGGKWDSGTDDAGDGGVPDAAIQGPQPPLFEDWTCPEGWLPAPAFIDENGIEDPPEGVSQFSVCRPPGDWVPVRMKDWTCPQGWNKAPAFTDPQGVENTPDGMPQYFICQPPPPPPSCPDGQMPMVGSPDCQPIGALCPRGEWPEGIPQTATVLHVKAGSTGGDGTPAAPLGMIGIAIAAAPAGAVIAIAAGTYAEDLVIDKEITLWGVCATGVTVAGSTADPGDPNVPESVLGAIHVAEGGMATVKNVTVTGARTGLRVVGGVLKAEGVRVKDATRIGAHASGGKMTLEGVAVTSTRPLPDGSRGRGVQADFAADVTVGWSLVERNSDMGVQSLQAGTLILVADSIVRGTKSRPDKTGGRGIGVETGAHLDVARSIIDSNREIGINAAGTGTNLTIADVMVTDTQARESDQIGGMGLMVSDGAHATVARALLVRNRSAAVYAYDKPNSNTPVLEMRDIVVRDTLPREADHGGGTGLDAADGAVVTVDRALVDRSCAAGVGLTLIETNGVPPEMTLGDVVVRDTRSQQKTKTGGRGLEVGDGGRLTVNRGLLLRNREMGAAAGIFTIGYPGVEMTLNDVVIRDTLPTEGGDAAGRHGRGLGVQDGAKVTVNRSLIEGSREIGVFVGLLTPGGALPSLDMSDVIVRDTRAQEAGHGAGRGFELHDAARVAITRCAVEESREIGFFAASLAPSGYAQPIALTDILIRDTRGMLDDQSEGMGLVVQDGAAIAMSRAVLDRNRKIAVLVSTTEPGMPLSSLVFADAVVRATLSTTGGVLEGLGGRGLHVQHGATAEVSRVVIAANREYGVYAVTTAGRLPPSVSLGDIVVRDTAIAACGEIAEDRPGSCIKDGVNYGGGNAVAAVGGAAVTLDGFEIAGNSLCGVQIVKDGRVAASRGSIHDNAIGVNVQVDGYDIGTVLSPTVRVYNNDTSVDSKDLPVPDPAAAVSSIE